MCLIKTGFGKPFICIISYLSQSKSPKVGIFKRKRKITSWSRSCFLSFFLGEDLVFSFFLESYFFLSQKLFVFFPFFLGRNIILFNILFYHHMIKLEKKRIKEERKVIFIYEL